MIFSSCLTHRSPLGFISTVSSGGAQSEARGFCPQVFYPLKNEVRDSWNSFFLYQHRFFVPKLWQSLFKVRMLSASENWTLTSCWPWLHSITIQTLFPKFFFPFTFFPPFPEAVAEFGREKDVEAFCQKHRITRLVSSCLTPLENDKHEETKTAWRFDWQPFMSIHYKVRCTPNRRKMWVILNFLKNALRAGFNTVCFGEDYELWVAVKRAPLMCRHQKTKPNNSWII